MAEANQPNSGGATSGAVRGSGAAEVAGAQADGGIAKRERFGSRLGFILISAGCAIGLGNVWRCLLYTSRGV